MIPAHNDKIPEDGIRMFASNIAKQVKLKDWTKLRDVEILVRLFGPIIDKKLSKTSNNFYTLLNALTDAIAEEEEDALFDVDNFVSYFVKRYPSQIPNVIMTLHILYDHLQQVQSPLYLKYGENIKILIYKLRNGYNKIKEK